MKILPLTVDLLCGDVYRPVMVIMTILLRLHHTLLRDLHVLRFILKAAL